MATPPRVTTIELDAAMERITRRHRQVDDPGTELIGTDPRDVLSYLHKHDTRGLPRWVIQADILDGLTLHTWLWWEDRRRLHTTLRIGRLNGLTWSQLGTPQGIDSPQGVKSLQDRLDALLRYDRPDEQLTRAARRLAAQDSQDGRNTWITEHTTELRDIAEQLLVEADQYNIAEREWLDELAADLDAEQFTPATMAVLGLAVAEVRTAPGITVLNTCNRVHRVLTAADQLRTSFARITGNTSISG